MTTSLCVVDCGSAMALAYYIVLSCFNAVSALDVKTRTVRGTTDSRNVLLKEIQTSTPAHSALVNFSEVGTCCVNELHYCSGGTKGARRGLCPAVNFRAPLPQLCPQQASRRHFILLSVVRQYRFAHP